MDSRKAVHFMLDYIDKQNILYYNIIISNYYYKGIF